MSIVEKNLLERLFGMSSGYVLHFSDRTFSEYFADSHAIDIYTPKYEYASGSKANRLRAFWRIENNHTVGKQVADFIDLILERADDPEAADLKRRCLAIADRLRSGAVVADLDALNPRTDDKTFHLLYREVKAAIDNGKPEAALDRLHTYAVKYLRLVCQARGIHTSNKPPNALMGEYVGVLKTNGEVESNMTMLILKNTTKAFDDFNYVRNEKSLAHDNILINAAESLLIVNSVASSIRFIQSIEAARVK